MIGHDSIKLRHLQAVELERIGGGSGRVEQNAVINPDRILDSLADLLPRPSAFA